MREEESKTIVKKGVTMSFKSVAQSIKPKRKP